MTDPANSSPGPPTLLQRPALVRYAAALALAVLAVLLTMAVSDLLTDSVFVLFFPAIIGAAWIGGFGPALVVVASALLGSVWTR